MQMLYFTQVSEPWPVGLLFYAHISIRCKSNKYGKLSPHSGDIDNVRDCVDSQPELKFLFLPFDTIFS